jgi:phage shock protein A
MMARIEDKLDALNTALTNIGNGVTGVQGDVTQLGTDIQTLKDQLANAGTLTPEQEAAFDAAITKATDAATALSALDALNPATPAT